MSLCKSSVFSLCVSLLLVCVESQAVQAGVQLNQTALFHDAEGGLSNATDLSGYLPSHSFALSDAGSGNASGLCFAPGDTDECAKVNSTWSFRNATYSDASNASVPWETKVTICVCEGASYDMDSLASHFSKVPIFLRQWVISISTVAAPAAHAYTSGGHITTFGNTTGIIDLMVHESSHAQDQDFSDSETFLTAIGNDTCVPDEYAQNNNVECYAQDMVVFIYSLLRPYDLGLSSLTDCMNEQLYALMDSDAPGMQEFIDQTVNTTMPNSCAVDCSHKVKEDETLQSIAAGCPGQTAQSLVPLNPQMRNNTLTVYPGENICFPASCCSQSRRLLSMPL